jgi:hypothetical protein
MTLLQTSTLEQAAPLWQGLKRNDELPGEMAIAVRASVGRTVVRGLLRHLGRRGFIARRGRKWVLKRPLPAPPEGGIDRAHGPRSKKDHQPTFRRRQSCSQSTAGRRPPTPPPPTDEQLWKDYQRRSMSVGAFPSGRNDSPSYSQHTPANARVQGLPTNSMRVTLSKGNKDRPQPSTANRNEVEIGRRGDRTDSSES